MMQTTHKTGRLLPGTTSAYERVPYGQASFTAPNRPGKRVGRLVRGCIALLCSGLTGIGTTSFGITGLSPARAAERPNVIFLLADDLGWNALNCYGSDLHPTPHLDRLAAEGVRFTNAYAACTVCSPTRAAVLTGKYPARLHLTDWIAGFDAPFAPLRVPAWTKHLQHSEVTLAEALQGAGHKTAHLGKWHLGGPQHYPEKQGFDINIGGTHRGSAPGGYFLPNQLDLPRAAEGDYLTDHLTDEAVRLIESWRDEPFFLYLAYYSVHTPIQGKPELVARYQQQLKGDSNRVHFNPTYAAMVHSLDESVGRILKTLDDLELAENTP